MKKSSYPALARFTEEMNLKQRNRGRHEVRLLSDIVFGDADIDELLRCNLDSCLSLAYQTSGMVPERKARLAARKDFASYKSAVGELKLASWFVGAGAQIIQWDPPARDGKGELLIRLGTTEIFVEVKTFLGDQDRTDAQRKTDRIAQDIERLRNKLGDFRYEVNLEESKGNYQTGGIKPLVISMIDQILNGEQRVEQVYNDEGIKATITLHSPADEAPGWITGYGLSIDDQSTFRDRLEHSQRSDLEICNVVCFYDFDWHIQSEEGESLLGASNVLYGTHVRDRTTPIHREYCYPDGIWKPGEVSSLDAVFIYSEKYYRTDIKSGYSMMSLVTGYANPNPTNQVTQDLFGSAVDRWETNDLPYESKNKK